MYLVNKDNIITTLMNTDNYKITIEHFKFFSDYFSSFSFNL